MDDRLRELVAEVLEIPPAAVSSELRRADVDSWDSMNHLRLVTAIEQEYGAAFTMEEIERIQTLADIEAVIGRSRDGVAHA